MRRVSLAVTLAVVVGGLALASSVLRARETGHPAPPQTERLLYLRSGQVADRLMLSFDALAADLYWIRAIQHYGRDVRAAERGRPRPDSFGLLHPLLDLTTTLDPYFSIAYRFGSLFLSSESPTGPGRPDQAIALLEKGLSYSPDRWQYAWDIGFVHYFYTRDFDEAARWLQRASEMPGAPAWIGPVAAVTLVQGGSRAQAREMWAQLQASPERYIRNAAQRGLAQLKALDGIDDLQQMVAEYFEAHLAYPRAWSDMPLFVGGPPGDDTGTPFVYDPDTHLVSLGPNSPLAPLPDLVRR